jgi:GntR family transcriptional regulator, transcriptional repressor for pyruvate dehydrogenase complex
MDTPDGKLHRASLSQQLADELMQQINDGLYPVGEVMASERAIGELYGVSRTVVREALQILVARGIVRVENGRGAIVREANGELVRLFFARALGQDLAAWRDLVVVRRLLEGHNVSVVARSGDAAAIQSIQEILSHMGDAVQDPPAYARLDVAFHKEIAIRAGNSLIVTLIESMHDSLRELIERSLLELSPDHFEAIHHLHEAIARALVAGDAEGARRAMNIHFDDVLIRLGEASQLE